MIIYSNRTSACNPFQRLKALAAADPLALLLELGALESAIADQCPPLLPPFAAALDKAASAWLSHTCPPCVSQLLSLPLPATLRMSRPEGFCDYAVTPEAYACAAAGFCRAHQPEEAVVVGIRSIGTTLSAVVAAVLRRQYCRVSRYTVRPTGHPYHREVSLPADAASPRGHGWHLVVDEGPGRSGSSFAAVANALHRAGVTAERIVLLPANSPDAGALCSEEGRQAWRTYNRIPASYTVPPFLRDAAEYPQGRRRKYIRHDGPIRFVARFAGVGPYGLAKLDLAQQLAAESFVPTPRCLHDGFLLSDWIDAPSDPPVTAGFLDHAARYLAFRAALPAPSAPGHSFDDLLELVEVNYTEAGLAPPSLAGARALIEGQPPSCVDGRLGGGKWLYNGHGYVKLDALDHYDDHFYPGPQDIAYDLAGLIEEFDLDTRAAAHLLHAFAQHYPGDHLGERVAFFQPVYRAVQMGYEAMQ